MPFVMKPYFVLLLIFFTVAGCSKKPDVVWKAKTGAVITHSPAVLGNKLIVGSQDHYVYAFDLKNGNLLWKTDLGERILMSPIVEGNHIYIGNAGGYFYQMNANDGSIGWKFKTKGMLEFDPCSDSDGIYFGSYDGNFYKINRQGQLIWALQTAHQMTSSCTFYKDMVITTSWDYNVYAIRRDSGQPVWKVGTGEFCYGNGIVVGDSFFYGTHHKLYRIDATTGKLLFEKDAAYNTHLATFQNFIFTQENGLTKRSLDGRVEKNLKLISFEEFVPHVVQDSIVISDTTNNLYGVSPDLEILWKFRAKNLFWASGVFSDGIYYVGNRDTYVYALKLPS